MLLTAGVDDVGRRLDRIVRKLCPNVPLSIIYRLLRKGCILVDGKKAEPHERIHLNSVIFIPFSASDTVSDRTTRLVQENQSTNVEIIAESEHLLALNKPSGMAVHDGKDSLTAWVAAYLAGKLRPSLSFTPGPLHRLDQATSGLIVFSKSLEGARLFTALIRERIVVKRYIALVDGRVDKEYLWEDLLLRDQDQRKTFANAQGKSALTRVFPLAVSARQSLVRAEIFTGRTHQIRAQASLHGHPLSGDKKYGGSFQKNGFLLHAFEMEFPSDKPFASQKLTARPPQAFQKKIEAIFERKIIIVT
ncbi:MAG: RluA family pseudouridine synthase [Treponema sp.]|nr:RluA family pseudouridine synthase [Treponema sp.]